MALSYTAKATGALNQTDESGARRRVLVTGAAGRIGSYFAEHCHQKYDLRLMDVKADGLEKVRDYGEIVMAELADIERLKEICAGIDTVVHMAGDPDASDTWSKLLDANIIGTYNLMVAAKAAGCRRVIHASSIHAVSGYPADVQVKTSDPVNPGDIYGVTKCFGEALGRYMAEKEGLSVIALRIGAFQPLEAAQSEKGVKMMDAFVSHRDLNQLIERCVDNETLQFAIFHGLSDNRFKRMDISDARELVGFAPQDNAVAESPQLKDLHLSEQVTSHSAIIDGQKSGIREDV